MSIHLAHQMPFDQLYSGLQEAITAGQVNKQVDPETGLELYCYSKSCVYERTWNDITKSARGLILSPTEKRIVATPFPKFFNVGEGDQTIPDEDFEVYEKLDGSLIIVYCYGGKWRTATKGSFKSDQAKAASEHIKDFNFNMFGECPPTLLCEYVGPSNRIVVHYPKDQLILLGIYGNTGEEYGYGLCRAIANSMGIALVPRHQFHHFLALEKHVKTLPASEEGFVIRYKSGLRLKMKGDEYKRIHALISDITPLGIHRLMEAGDSLDEIKQQLPEEFWTDFDKIHTLLDVQMNRLIDSVVRLCRTIEHLSNKEVGLNLESFPENLRRFIFPYRNNKGNLLTGRSRDLLYRTIRPTSNKLEGYTPSYAVNRVQEEDA